MFSLGYDCFCNLRSKPGAWICCYESFVFWQIPDISPGLSSIGNISSSAQWILAVYCKVRFSYKTPHCPPVSSDFSSGQLANSCAFGWFSQGNYHNISKDLWSSTSWWTLHQVPWNLTQNGCLVPPKWYSPSFSSITAQSFTVCGSQMKNRLNP